MPTLTDPCVSVLAAQEGGQKHERQPSECSMGLVYGGFPMQQIPTGPLILSLGAKGMGHQLLADASVLGDLKDTRIKIYFVQCALFKKK